MRDLREQLSRILQGHACLVGVGNVDAGDDGAGVRLAGAVAESEIRNPTCAIREVLAAPGRSRGDEAHTPVSAETPDVVSYGPQTASRNLGVRVVLAGLEPERHLSQLADGRFDHVVFLDAVDCGAEPGAVALLNASEMASRFPQVSTHRISLGLLARLIEAEGRTRVWLLGIQPGTLRRGDELSRAVQASVDALVEVVRGLAAVPHEPGVGRAVLSAPAFRATANVGGPGEPRPDRLRPPEPAILAAPC